MGSTKPAIAQSKRIGRQIYTGFNERRLELWDEVISPEVELRSTVGSQPVRGIEPLKAWAAAFQTEFKPRLDLVDEIYGVNRAVIAVNLVWQHVGEFFGLAPTGRMPHQSLVKVTAFSLNRGEVGFAQSPTTLNFLSAHAVMARASRYKHGAASALPGVMPAPILTSPELSVRMEGKFEI